eukprot:TRINITY_DN5764_c0_g1_i2.p1 TRINITY_DN5764_c0_g1~~TRINITY_DN5764_c0_g1_i2.p1  ORF type:complete len:224 (+),score=19.05 TRINITY_DN5764_c0_g1_i2:269-940(+)
MAPTNLNHGLRFLARTTRSLRAISQQQVRYYRAREDIFVPGLKEAAEKAGFPQKKLLDDLEAAERAAAARGDRTADVPPYVLKDGSVLRITPSNPRPNDEVPEPLPASLGKFEPPSDDVVAEMRAKRQEDPEQWSAKKLASEYGLPEWQVRRLAPAPRTLRRESSVRARQREAERQARFELNGRGLTRDLAERTRRALDAPATVRTKRSHGLGWIKTSTAGAQ